jgi:hypothetical protein
MVDDLRPVNHLADVALSRSYSALYRVIEDHQALRAEMWQ